MKRGRVKGFRSCARPASRYRLLRGARHVVSRRGKLRIVSLKLTDDRSTHLESLEPARCQADLHGFATRHECVKLVNIVLLRSNLGLFPIKGIIECT